MKRFQAMCLAAMTAAAGLALSQAASAAVFDEVPSDSLAVLEVRNVDQLNTKWGKFADATGLTQLNPDVANPLKSTEDEGGITAGVNSGGDFAAVLIRTAEGGAGGAGGINGGPGQPGQAAHGPDAVFLVPVSDYKAFLGNFAAGQEDTSGVTATKDKSGSDMFIAHWGDYAAVSDKKDVVSNKPQGVKLEGISADAVKNNDAIVWINADQLRAQLLPKLKDNRDAILDKISNRGGNANPVMAKIGWNLMLDQAQEFLTDVKDSVITLNVTDDGVAISGMTDFLPNTLDSQLAAAMKGTDQPMLTGLPDKRYLMLFGEMLSPELKQQLTASVLDPATKKLDAADAKNKPLLDMLAAGKAKLAAIDSVAGGLVVPTGNPGQDSMVQMVLAITGDGPAWEKAQLAGLQAINDLSKKGDPAAPMTVTVTTKPGATTVGDVHLDKYSFNLDFNQNDPKAARAQQIIPMVYGPNGIMGYLGVASDKVGVFSLGIDDQSPLLADAIAAAKTGKDVLSSAKTIQDISAKLPTQRVAEGFIYVDQIFGLGMRIAQSFGLRVHVNVPADVDPIGFALSGNGSAVQGNLFVPKSLVKSIVDVANGLHGAGGGNGGGQPMPGGGGGL